ncbi:MAG: hypothetical protein ACE5GK_00355 [Nitrospiria bacterium]
MQNRNILQATAATPVSEKRKTPGRRTKKEGRGFFIGLLTLSGIIIVCLGLIYFQGKEIMIFTFEKFVVNKALVSLLPPEYTLEQAEAIRTEVYAFFEAASSGEVDDAALIEVSSEIQIMIEDSRILEEEVASLLILIRKKMEH